MMDMNRDVKRMAPVWFSGAVLVGMLVSSAWAATPKPAASGQHVRHGVVVDFDAQAVNGAPDKLVAGELARIRIRLTEEETGNPVTGITPGVWLDMGEVLQGKAGRDSAQQKSCKEKIALYLKGVVGIRPMLDLNSYYIVVMNQEPSLSVVDPLVSMAGVTSTLGQIALKGVATDWAADRDQKTLFVSMPATGYVAIVDTTAFEVATNVEAGVNPTRVVLQPDGRFVWVGNDSDSEEESGVTVIDVQTLSPVASIKTGLGHHEIAFSSDSQTAFVSNRESGTVSIIDVAALKKTKDLETGPLPISIAYSSLSEALYVADGRSGTVSIISGSDREIVKRIQLEPGLGPIKFDLDGRYALNVNPTANTVVVIDATTNQQVNTVDVDGMPYQVSFSRAFAYVRALSNPRVTMINLSSLGDGNEPIVQGFDAGAGAPMNAGNLPIASGAAFTTSEAAVFIVNPTDNTTYFYMEGMNAAAGNYRVFGASARAVTVVDRSMRESAPGEFVSTVKIPAAGRYDVAFMLETPQILHCFSADASPGAEPTKSLVGMSIEYLQDTRRVSSNRDLPLRFRLTSDTSNEPLTGVSGVSVLFFRTPGADRTVVAATEVGDGVYTASLPIGRSGGYYVHVGVPSRSIGYSKLPFFTLAAIDDESASP